MTTDLATRADRLATEEARLGTALSALAQPLSDARLAAYRIRRFELWKAAVDDQGRPRHNTLGDYFMDRWASQISRTLFFGYGSTLQRLESVGLLPETITANGPSHDWDHAFTLRMGTWDYRKQHLAAPALGLLALQAGDETIQETVKRIYLESKADELEYGAGEALNILDQRLGKPTVEFFQDSEDDAPLKLRVEVTQLHQHFHDPTLITQTFRISSDKTLPREVILLLKKRRWVKPNN